MKNFCPKCGNSLKPNAKFCPKCGTKIESKVSPRQNMTEQVVQQVPKKPKKFKNYKAFIIAMAVIIVAIAGGFGFVIYQKNSQASKATSVLTHKSNKAATKKTNNAAQSDNQSASQNDSNYSIDEWMLMGYMAYAHDNYVESRHISGTSDLVEDVGEDIANSDLKVDKNSDTSYTLTNKFGSVDVDVDSNDVKVKADNGDEVTTDKDKLEDTFSSYKGQIQKMTSYIKSGNSDSKEDNNSDSAKSDKKSNDSDEEFSNEEYVVAAFLSAKGTPQEEINRVEKLLAQKLDAPNDDYLTGVKNPSDNYYYVAFNASTSQYERYTIEDKYVIGQPYGGGVSGQKKKYDKKTLVNNFKSYKADLDKILAGFKYNNAHLDDFNDKVRGE